jgi:hypothetical protein
VAPSGSWSCRAIRNASRKFNLRYSLALTMQRHLLATHYRSSLPSPWSQKCVAARIVDDFLLKGWIEWTECNQVGHGTVADNQSPLVLSVNYFGSNNGLGGF